MKKKKMSELSRRKNGAKRLPRWVGRRCPEFKISAIQMDDLCLTRNRVSASSSECP